MEIDKAIEQAKSWLGNKVKNPYFGSVITIWIITNRTVVFGIFNFETTLTLNERILWVHQQLETFRFPFIPKWHGIEATIIWSLLAGYFLMIVLNLVSGLIEASYKWSDKIKIKLLHKEKL